MATREIVLSEDWQQITDGTTQTLLQVIGGELRLCAQTNKPDMDAVAHVVSGFISITPPTIAWVRIGEGIRGVRLIVT